MTTEKQDRIVRVVLETYFRYEGWTREARADVARLLHIGESQADDACAWVQTLDGPEIDRSVRMCVCMHGCMHDVQYVCESEDCVCVHFFKCYVTTASTSNSVSDVILRRKTNESQVSQPSDGDGATETTVNDSGTTEAGSMSTGGGKKERSRVLRVLEDEPQSQMFSWVLWGGVGVMVVVGGIIIWRMRRH